MAVVANKRSVMTLYSDAKCPYCHGARFVLSEKSVTFEVQEFDANQENEDLIELNPYNTVPTLVDRDLTLYNTRVIMEYLDERFPHPPLLPVDPVSRARARLWIQRVEQDWYGMLPNMNSSDKDLALRSRKEFAEQLMALGPLLEAQPYFMSEELSMVDCWIAPLLWRLPKWGIQLPRSAKSVLEYADRLFARESFQASLSDTEREIREPKD